LQNEEPHPRERPFVGRFSDAASPLRGRRAKGQVPRPSEREASKCLALVLPDDGHGDLAEPAVDVDAEELRLAAAVPNAGRVRPHAVARHGEQEGGEDGVGHRLAVHLLHPLRALRGVEEPREVSERSGLRLLDVGEHVAVLTIPVGSEVHGLHLNGVRPELAGTRDELDALVIDPACVRLLPLGVATLEGLHHEGAAVEKSGREALAVDHDDEVQERVVRALGLKARDGAVLSSEGDGRIHIGRVDVRPGLDHRDLVRERGEPSVDEAEGGLGIDPGDQLLAEL
jgi:hypothetical protein